ncbi:hypothetical protein DCE79_10860 [Lysinibacillus sp. 2017]|uniref:hypothetical protein n=1 Tax=unclassified Lysinibacillus TaxID=2636778 RepID=UPI000D526AD1|nr:MULTISPECIES: hypothetical protein [unclassified Lysinibacillus]AWE07856.1 hypothetical protein DCE79_10860 [Lysinibacillus sp. 2017]TGN29934.1 hypothetical protein E4L99_17740 [Lysinibacillus sp. S2017]
MEWQQLQKQSENYKLQLLEVEKLNKKKITMERLIQHAQREITHFNQELASARKDLNKLEEYSFVNLFREWSGKKDELIEQNLDRVAVTELKLVESQLTYEDLQDDLVDIIHKLNAINEEFVVKELDRLDRKKQLYIMQHAPLIADKLTEIMEQELLCKQLIVEIGEAIDAGNKALSTLTDAGSSLHQASNYSTWDTFLGGGFMATALKHEKLDESNSQLHLAQIALQRFSNELLDVKDMRNDAIQIDTDGFVKFTDYFFDNIFTDWSIHSKISTSMNQISRVQDDVSNTIQLLENKLNSTLRKEAELFREKEQILTADEQSLFFQK